MKNVSNFEMLNSGSCDEFEEGDDDKEEESDDSDIETLDIDDDDAPTSAPGNSQLRGLPPGITVTTVVESGTQLELFWCGREEKDIGQFITLVSKVL